ncbi:transcriptional regulator [Streptomyces chrestomyceticus JCM 4735]|uniref:Transcriptional regulator n=1 Tax=Streptomyces chrestomyceticus JCM 4735 TaxID=1306181 RepID=A0A7U9L5Q6_9ACTN|nr:hypothetical protein [Streptomyces chrestomyceticus]GCD40086.1 transcriptional regulator [Streptomyces chrestomyceticus JCM 4735]
MSREGKIAQTFVELADTLVADFDVIDFLQQLTARCRDIFAVTDAAVVLAYPGPQMYSPAPCDPSPALSRVLDVALREGPALDAYRTAEPVAPATSPKLPPRGPTSPRRPGQPVTPMSAPSRCGCAGRPSAACCSCGPPTVRCRWTTSPWRRRSPTRPPSV